MKITLFKNLKTKKELIREKKAKKTLVSFCLAQTMFPTDKGQLSKEETEAILSGKISNYSDLEKFREDKMREENIKSYKTR